MRLPTIALLATLTACASAPRPFPLREPFTVDTDLQPVSVPCRPDPSKKEPDRVTCAPQPYVSPFIWDHIDNDVFARVSRALSIDVSGEAANPNSLDEVPDSSWFENRIGAHQLEPAQSALGGCSPDDILPANVADGAWVIDHGKDNGSTPGFRVDVPGKGKYLLKADQPGKPERASAASVIGAALYHAVGFSVSCEQVVMVKKSQLKLTPGLTVTDNFGDTKPFDEAAFEKTFASSNPVDGVARFVASKWLPGMPIGPFRYEGTRSDDPNDIIAHDHRRELRGSRLLAAWINHWDAREQNSMDIWFATDPAHERGSPGVVRHYVLDTSDTLGGADTDALARRFGHTYTFDPWNILVDLVTLGIVERPWDRAHREPGHEEFEMFRVDDFEPERWKPQYPNPAMLRMTERDGAWMARIIARVSPGELRAIVKSGRFKDPRDAEYLTSVLIGRQLRILRRYLTVLSPLADVRRVGDDQLCALDLARVRGVLPEGRFRYSVVERGGGQRISLPATPTRDGRVCFTWQPLAAEGPDDSPQRRVVFEIRNGTSAGPLEIHTYNLGTRGMQVVGLMRPAP